MPVPIEGVHSFRAVLLTPKPGAEEGVFFANEKHDAVVCKPEQVGVQLQTLDVKAFVEEMQIKLSDLSLQAVQNAHELKCWPASLKGGQAARSATKGKKRAADGEDLAMQTPEKVDPKRKGKSKENGKAEVESSEKVKAICSRAGLMKEVKEAQARELTKKVDALQNPGTKDTPGDAMPDSFSRSMKGSKNIQNQMKMLLNVDRLAFPTKPLLNKHGYIVGKDGLPDIKFDELVQRAPQYFHTVLVDVRGQDFSKSVYSKFKEIHQQLTSEPPNRSDPCLCSAYFISSSLR